jgi:hypothetical protein
MGDREIINDYIDFIVDIVNNKLQKKKTIQPIIIITK